MKTTIKTIANEVKEVLLNVNENQAVQVSHALQKAKRIFVLGEGRSGLMGKAFAMRLMHGGFTVYVVGETITPSINRGDLLVAISGSGKTEQMVQFANKAHKAGARVLAVTAQPTSPLASLSDTLLTIPAATKYRHEHEPKTIQPLGNQFDQSLHLMLDAIIIDSLRKKETNDIQEDMRNRHANLE
ncbi:6-phospho-3-hexuloisomerase [Caldalkalibacillus salinus]|uniref:6-phospho-3-hexuloisomerase n=1 Tax=Caldalkalibacillus salinus TaxID=2803787 RepID=UPI001920CD8A|nr:6-phospho-3-hexuloisomerase [Caldalkalibacillus salinus]